MEVINTSPWLEGLGGIALIIPFAIHIFFLLLAAVGLILLIKVALRAITALDIYIKQNSDKT